MDINSQKFYEVEPRDYKEMLERMKKEFFMLSYEAGENFRSYLFMDNEDYTPYFQCLIENCGMEDETHTYYIYNFPDESKLKPAIPKFRIQIDDPKQLQVLLDAVLNGGLDK